MITAALFKIKFRGTLEQLHFHAYNNNYYHCWWISNLKIDFHLWSKTNDFIFCKNIRFLWADIVDSKINVAASIFYLVSDRTSVRRSRWALDRDGGRRELFGRIDADVIEFWRRDADGRTGGGRSNVSLATTAMCGDSWPGTAETLPASSLSGTEIFTASSLSGGASAAATTGGVAGGGPGCERRRPEDDGGRRRPEASDRCGGLPEGGPNTCIQ